MNNMIIKNPKTFIPLLVAVLLIVLVSVGSTFIGVMKENFDLLDSSASEAFPEMNMVFTSDSSDLEQIGREAAVFYYTQFMKDDISRYWHVTKYEITSCEFMAGDENEFAVWVTSYLETDGTGFLVGEGIPNDRGDISRGGICPEVGRQLRIKALGEGNYQIVSIGTGGGTQGLEPTESETATTVNCTDLDARVSAARQHISVPEQRVALILNEKRGAV